MTAGWLAAHGLQPRTLTAAQISDLLPQRYPLLLVDQVLAVAAPERASSAIAAALQLRGDEPVLAGHFPSTPVWPGSYTLEGLAQTCALLGALAAPNAQVGNIFLASARIKFTGVVTPPARLDYFAEEISHVGDLRRFAVEAFVGGRAVASGTLDVLIRGSDR